MEWQHVILLVPLASACLSNIKSECCESLKKLSVKDSILAFRAIRKVNPGGLGESPEQDVKSEPTVTLLEAMKLAADRDMIARQYANGYADVFDFGVPAFLAAFEKFGRVWSRRLLNAI